MRHENVTVTISLWTWDLELKAVQERPLLSGRLLKVAGRKGIVGPVHSDLSLSRLIDPCEKRGTVLAKDRVRCVYSVGIIWGLYLHDLGANL